MSRRRTCCCLEEETGINLVGIHQAQGLMVHGRLLEHETIDIYYVTNLYLSSLSPLHLSTDASATSSFWSTVVLLWYEPNLDQLHRQRGLH